jgi:3-methylfumaryl-CoA hydratase
MWAGGRLEFLQPLRVGDEATRHSQIASVTSKSGTSGALVFVTVRHEIKVDAKLALTEEHDIVYRQAPAAGAPAPALQPAPTDEAFARAVVPDPVLLFRYSALTFNGHRIHYDRRYVVEVEGYPGLVVHGPLIATLLLDLLRRERAGIAVRQFRFRAMAPLFDLWPFTLCGRPDGAGGFALWARGPNGELAMSASAAVG